MNEEKIEKESEEELEKLRKDIDFWDELIIRSLSKRDRIVNEVVALKKKIGKPILDSTREAKIIGSRIRLGQENGLDDPEFITDIFRIMMHHSKSKQHSECGVKIEYDPLDKMYCPECQFNTATVVLNGKKHPECPRCHQRLTMPKTLSASR